MIIKIPNADNATDNALIEGSRRELALLSEACQIGMVDPSISAEGQLLYDTGVILIIVRLTPCRENMFRTYECSRGTQGCDDFHEGEDDS